MRRRAVLRVPNNGDADVIIETAPPIIAPQDTAGLQTVGLVFVFLVMTGLNLRKTFKFGPT